MNSSEKGHELKSRHRSRERERERERDRQTDRGRGIYLKECLVVPYQSPHRCTFYTGSSFSPAPAFQARDPRRQKLQNPPSSTVIKS